MSSGKWPTLIKTTLLRGQARVIVAASLPTNPSRDVRLKIPTVWQVRLILTALQLDYYYIPVYYIIGILEYLAVRLLEHQTVIWIVRVYVYI